MTDAPLAETVGPGCTNLRQGDVVDLPRLPIVVGEVQADPRETPRGVAVLSQTCDVVQPSKSRCLVAPVMDADQNQVADARKGRKPLWLCLESRDEEVPARIVDIELATSVPKDVLVGRKVLARYAEYPSDAQAGNIAARVGRAYGRFPFPDEVYPVFGELRSRAQSRSGTQSPFGQTVDLVEDLRVGADQWPSPGRRLTLYVVVPETLLAPVEDLDPTWTWDASRVEGLRGREKLGSIRLNRVCELILANLAGDRTTLAHLWQQFGERVRVELLEPRLDLEVVEFSVEVLADSEMSVRQYRRTESLDLEVLSDSSWQALNDGAEAAPGSTSSD